MTEAKSPREIAEALTHGMNCAGLRGEHPLVDHPDCTCGLRWRIYLRTEQEMHAAWRKRAEEAESYAAERERLLRDSDEGHYLNWFVRDDDHASQARYERLYKEAIARHRLSSRPAAEGKEE